MSSTHATVAIDAHFAGTISPEDERSMRAHLSDCERCQLRYRRHLLLAKLDPHALDAEERIGRALGISKPQRVTSSSSPFTTLVRGVTPIRIAATLALAAVLVLWLRTPRDEGFTSRGSGSMNQGPASRIVVYRVGAEPRDGAPSPVTRSIRRDDELAFAYENGAKKERLMVFGVDEHGHVYWFHPGWSNEGENPSAVAIAKDGGRQEIREAIAHRLDGERLEIHAVFVDAPLTVRAVEDILAKRAAPVGALQIPGAVDDVVMLEVTQ
jgi:hypothetical protein